MFNRLSHERGFLLTRPSEAANPTRDPAGVGRGVGPDRTLRGAEVLAVIQVVDREGRPVGGLGLGAHRLLPGGHAEEQALAGIARDIPPSTDLKGGRMMVIVDQYPCGPGSANCGQQLRDFARQRGLTLEVRVPLRENVQRPGQVVSPRTASRGAFRTDLAADPRTAVRLVPVEVTAGPGGGGPGGTGSGPTSGARGGPGGALMRPSAELGSGAVSATKPPTLSPRQRAQVVSRQALTAQLESETLEAARFAGRVRVYTAAFGAIMQILGALDQMEQAQRMLQEGTIFGDAQRRADALAEQGDEAVHNAESMTDNISILSATSIVGDALEAGDIETLFSVGGKLADVSLSFEQAAAPLQTLAEDLDRRARATDVLADFYGKLMYLPTDPFAGTAPQAHAFTMHESLAKFSAACSRGSGKFAQAAQLLSFYAQFTRGLAYKANRGAWSGVGRKLVEAQRSQQAAAPEASGATSAKPAHAAPPGPRNIQPRHEGFPSLEEQQGTPCPNCHRPAGGGRPQSPVSPPGMGSGPGGQMTEDDLRVLRQWVQAPQKQ